MLAHYPSVVALALVVGCAGSPPPTTTPNDPQVTPRDVPAVASDTSRAITVGVSDVKPAADVVSKDEVANAIRALGTALGECHGQSAAPPPTVKVRITLYPDGTPYQGVKNMEIAHDDAAARACIADAIGTLKLSPLTGGFSSIDVSFVLTFTR